MVALVVLALFRVPVANPPSRAKEKALIPAAIAFIPSTSADGIADLLDPTPLFLPTKWNAQAIARPRDGFREPGTAFQDYLPQFAFAEDAARLSFPPIVNVPEKTAELLEIGKATTRFWGLGQKETGFPVFPGRDAFVEIAPVGGGNPLVREALHDAKPPAAPDWKPLEFLAVVEPAGLIAEPSLVGVGSGFEPVDAFFQNYLAKRLRVGERLPPGFYRITVGP